jgi:hypothetical protein
MDRRTKIILLIIGSVLLVGAILWFVVWPLLQPVLPRIAAQPPAHVNANPVGNVPGKTAGGSASGTAPGEFTYETYQANPDIATINEMKRRAGILAERAESGSSADGFTNYADAGLNTTKKLQSALGATADAMRKAHPAAGPLYLTIASRLVEIPENDMKINGNAFTVRVRLQVDVRDGGNRSTEYREVTVSFVLSGAQWLPDTYDVKPFSP